MTCEYSFSSFPTRKSNLVHLCLMQRSGHQEEEGRDQPTECSASLKGQVRLGSEPTRALTSAKASTLISIIDSFFPALHPHKDHLLPFLIPNLSFPSSPAASRHHKIRHHEIRHHEIHHHEIRLSQTFLSPKSLPKPARQQWHVGVGVGFLGKSKHSPHRTKDLAGPGTSLLLLGRWWPGFRVAQDRGRKSFSTQTWLGILGKGDSRPHHGKEEGFTV